MTNRVGQIGTAPGIRVGPELLAENRGFPGGGRHRSKETTAVAAVDCKAAAVEYFTCSGIR